MLTTEANQELKHTKQKLRSKTKIMNIEEQMGLNIIRAIHTKKMKY